MLGTFAQHPCYHCGDHVRDSCVCLAYAPSGSKPFKRRLYTHILPYTGPCEGLINGPSHSFASFGNSKLTKPNARPRWSVMICPQPLESENENETSLLQRGPSIAKPLYQTYGEFEAWSSARCTLCVAPRL